jgi:hypothetical protein
VHVADSLRGELLGERRHCSKSTWTQDMPQPSLSGRCGLSPTGLRSPHWTIARAACSTTAAWVTHSTEDRSTGLRSTVASAAAVRPRPITTGDEQCACLLPGRTAVGSQSPVATFLMTQNASVPAVRDTEAVLVTGVYGAGKSTVVADIGKILADRGQRYGLIDVDWLGWFDTGVDEDAWRQIVLSNLQHVAAVYVTGGARRLALAWAIRNSAELEQVRRAVSVPLRVVRLEVAADLVQRRLRADPTEERRHDDLQTALQWLADGEGTGLAELLVPGDQPVREISLKICRWLGWI